MDSPRVYTDSTAKALRLALQHHFLLPSKNLPLKSLTNLLNTCFWASLKTEEAQQARIAVVLTTPGEYMDRYIALHPRSCSIELLAKLSPVVRNRDVYLLIKFHKRLGPQIWGICERPLLSITVQSLSPGHLVVNARGELVADLPPGKPPRIAPNMPNWVFQIAAFLSGFSEIADQGRFRFATHLRYIAKAMLHGRGGSLLIVPKSMLVAPVSHNARERPLDIQYSVNSDQLNFVHRYLEWEKQSLKDQRALDRKLGYETTMVFLSPDSTEERAFNRAATLIGMLTAVDGSTVISTDFTLIGFGSKIVPTDYPPEFIQICDPWEDESPTEIPFSDLGGMRHRSAAQFVNENRDTLALVVSQDGRVTLFRKQRALRLEKLL